MSWSSYRELRIWQSGMELVEHVYRITQDFPSEEKFGLTAQIRRSAVSVPSNIAEGTARIGKKQFLLFLSYAQGSLAELETQLLIAQRIGLLHCDNLPIQKIKKCRITIQALVNKLRK